MTSSIWLQNKRTNIKPPLEESIQTDVCIIGGGLSGIMTAYHLAKAGKEVVLLEGNSLLHGATGHSTGKLTAQHGPVYQTIIEKFGRESALLYYELNQKAISTALDLVDSSIIQPATSFLYTQEGQNIKKLEDEWAAYKQLHIPGTFGEKGEIPYEMKASVAMLDQAQIHPVLFGQSIMDMATKAGAKFYENSRVAHINLSKPYVELENKQTVYCKDLVICSHYPLEAIIGLQLVKLQVNRSYIIAFKCSEPYSGQYLSIDQPNRSVRTVQIGDDYYTLLVGSSQRAGSSSNTNIFYEAIEKEAYGNFAATDIRYKWSAQDPETPDLLPYVGQISSGHPNIWLATGFRKWGISNSLVAGQIVSDGILGRPNSGIELYSPKHTKIGDALLQALKVGGQTVIDLVGGYVTRSSMPRCTHLGCKTRWNEADETWDCSCHGSRFAKDGSVLEGPAVKPLNLKK
ncbi:FAD-dependent oxidoreductase [Rummeliibacillus pycnus]|uniref:FAD-dependent oxidoreductase n=1 Tax=Rummeliibacillus pycnus TaxID=101070 RepID=UPI003D2E7C7E